MKKLMNKVSGKMNRLAVRTRCVLASCKGEGFVDSGVKILIAVVIGALLLAGMCCLMRPSCPP